MGNGILLQQTCRFKREGVDQMELAVLTLAGSVRFSVLPRAPVFRRGGEEGNQIFYSALQRGFKVQP